MTFEFDEEKTLSNFASSGMVDMQVGLVSAYAVVCVGSDDSCPTSSHGGGLTFDGPGAIDAAKAANAMSAGCRYLPVPIGVDPVDILKMAKQLLSEGPEEP